MKFNTIKTTLTAAALVLTVGPLFATDIKPTAATPVQANASAPKTKASAPTKAVKGPVTAVKLVDINSASKDELMQLPNISDVEADKIITGRPYGSKAWLVSNKILPVDKFATINRLIIAKQKASPAAKAKKK